MALKCQLFVFVFFLLNSSLALKFTTEIKSHYDNNFDITTVFKLLENNDTLTTCSRPDKSLGIADFEGCYNGEIHLRRNAIGMPIYYNERVLSLKENYLEFIVDSYYEKKIITNNHVEYNPSYWMFGTEFDTRRSWIQATGGLIKTNSLYHRPNYPFNISWTPDTTTRGCLSLTYATSYSPTVYLNLYEEEISSPIISYTIPITYEANLKTLILRTNELFLRKNTYHLVITLKYDEYNDGYFGLKRIAQCNEDEEVYKISGTEVSSLSANIYQLDGSKSADSALVYKECNKNKFGSDCSGTCSTRETFCQRMLFCTSRYGCSCASGYTGQFCDQKCPLGTYGRDCQKKCGENCNSCDIYTGVCIGGCKNNFILPNCTEKYPWLITPPQLVSSDYNSVKLNVSFEINNIAGSKQKTPLYYQIVYKQATSTSDFDFLDVKKIGDSNYTIDKIGNLLLGTEYTFGAVVITNDGNFNNEDRNTKNYKTQCLIPKNMDYRIKLAKDAKNITVTWEKYNKKDILECEIINYMVKLIFNQKNNVHEVAYTSSNKYVFDNLVPGHTYAVQVTANTTFGPTEPSDLYYETTDMQGYISIGNITANVIDSDTVLHLTWDLNDDDVDAPMSYMIKYKINRHYSCPQRTVNSNWTKIVVDNKTECNILDLIPNTQYIIKVEPITTGYTYGPNENTVFVKTTTSTPSLAPVLDVSQLIYVNNQTALIKWYVDKEKCNKLNGIVTGFHIVLKNLMDMTQTVKETEETAVEYTNLNPTTDYELRVYIKTDKGFNVNYALLVPFKTKSKYLPPVEELSVYKKNPKSREIGLRWNYCNDTEVNGFIIQANPDSQKTNVKQKTIEPLKCKAWPTMYCTTVDNLTRSTQYTIKVLAKSVDYPSGGLPGSINFNTMDGSPDEPKNIKAICVDTKNVTIEWDIPWVFNGALDSFIINVEEISAVDADSCCASFPVMELQVTEELPTYNYTINDLKPGSTYLIGVMSKTLWYSQANKIHVTTLLDTAVEMLPSEVSEDNSTETN